MNESIKIGIPRALLYHKYGVLWETFFRALGVESVLSPETNRKIFNDGLKAAVDESCLPMKVYLGHVAHLIGKCDYILIPRIENLGKDKTNAACVKFFAAYDIINNTFKERLVENNTKLLDYNVDVFSGKTEDKAFVKMARVIDVSGRKSKNAYINARKAQDVSDALKHGASVARLSAEGPKILIVSHAYNIYDSLIGASVAATLKKMGMTAVLANEFDKRECAEVSANVSQKLYWIYNKELAGAAHLYKGCVDGIVFMTAFPCGPDSLVTELMLRKFAGIPMLNIVLDELQSESGLQTRLESFVDIIIQRRKTAV